MRNWWKKNKNDDRFEELMNIFGFLGKLKDYLGWCKSSRGRSPLQCNGSDVRWRRVWLISSENSFLENFRIMSLICILVGKKNQNLFCSSCGEYTIFGLLLCVYYNAGGVWCLRWLKSPFVLFCFGKFVVSDDDDEWEKGMNGLPPTQQTNLICVRKLLWNWLHDVLKHGEYNHNYNYYLKFWFISIMNCPTFLNKKIFWKGHRFCETLEWNEEKLREILIQNTKIYISLFDSFFQIFHEFYKTHKSRSWFNASFAVFGGCCCCGVSEP